MAVDVAGNNFIIAKFNGGAMLGTAEAASNAGPSVPHFNAPQEAPPQVPFRISNDKQTSASPCRLRLGRPRLRTRPPFGKAFFASRAKEVMV